MRVTYIVSIFLFFIHPLLASEVKKEMSLSQVFELMINSSNQELIISDIIIKIDTTKDRRYFSENLTYGLGLDAEIKHDLSSNQSVLEINPQYIVFKNVEVESELFSIVLFHKINLNSDLYFENCSFDHLVFTNSRIDGDLYFDEETNIGMLGVSECQILGQISIGSAKIEKSLVFFKSTFAVSPDPLINDFWSGHRYIDLADRETAKPLPYVAISNCTFQSEDSIANPFVSLSWSYFKKLVLLNNSFDVPVKMHSSNFEYLQVCGNRFLKSVNILNSNYPKANICSWEQFEGGLGSEWLNYSLADSLLFKDLNDFKQLIATHYEVYRIFKDRGDIEEANKCFVDIKDLETRKWKHVYKNQGTTQALLNWQLNRFLKYFADYGTSPIRSLVVSFWVVLVFSAFYFFSKSDWDNINRKYLVKQSELIMDYFTSEQKLEDFYSEAYKQDFLEYNEFKQKIRANKSQIPFFFLFFLKPLYYLSVVKHIINTWMYRRLEILGGKWVDLTSQKKLVVGSIVAITSIGYLLYLFIVRALNSIVLSINTFSTLGFGDIPVKGIMRYVAIIEGFLGWFLLSIFSVSLISQILQN